MAVRFQRNGWFRKPARDYSQLDLFTDLPEEPARLRESAENAQNSDTSPETIKTSADTAAASQPLPRETETTDGRHEPIGRPDSETLDNPPAGADRRAGKDEPVADRAAPGAGTDGRSSLQADGGPEDGVPRGLGTGDEGMGNPSGRAPPGPTPLGATPTGSSIIRQADPEPDPTPSRDFRITDSDRIGEGSLRDKAFDNIEAMRNRE
jgi:hypothetical protein